MKRIFSLLLVLTLLTGLLAACGGGSASSAAPAGSDSTAASEPAEGGDSTAEPAGDGEPVELYMFISQPEYADAINALLEEYKTVAPNVTINYETTQNDYPTLLKAKLNSGDVPDIFTSTAGKEIDLYTEYSMNLAGQPVADAMLPAVSDSMSSMSTGEGPYGFAIKGNFFGLIYNKDIFEEVGVQPPTTLDELESVCEALSAAGYQPFTTGFAEWWVFKHSCMPFFGAASDDAIDLVSKFENGEAKLSDYPVLYDNMFRFLDIVTKYGDSKPLESDLSGEIAAFANGQAAMINGQGAWVEANIMEINPEANIGFTGYPVSDDPADCKVVTGADQAMRVSNQSAHEAELLDFVNWWYTSDYGQSWFVDVANVVPPITVEAESTFEVIKQGTQLVEEQGSGPLTIIYSTDSFHTAFGEAMQAYVGGTADKDATCATIETKWVELDGPDA